MPTPLDYSKSSLVNDLWLPLAKQGGDLLYPRRKKHKNLTLFTLTDMDYQEVKAFESNKLIKRENVIAWNYSYQKGLRLETELGQSKVFHEGRYEEIILESQNILGNPLWDVINLDFLSQNLMSSNGRIEKELNGENVVVKLLNTRQSRGFILLYTTLLDQIELTLNTLSFSQSLPPEFENPVCSIDNKVKLIETSLQTIFRANNYTVNEHRRVLFNSEGKNKVFSIGFIILRGN